MMIRSLLALAAILCSFFAPGGNARAQIPQGAYDQCASGCTANLDAAKAIGFTQVVNYALPEKAGNTAPDDNAYASEALARGITVWWQFSDEYQSWPADRPQVERLVKALRSNPATAGFYIADEPPVADVQKVRAMAADIHRLAPGVPQLLVACGACSGIDPQTLLEPFEGLPNSYEGLDRYPDIYATDSLGSLAGYMTAAAQVSVTDAQQAGQRSAVVLQMFSYSQVWRTPYPTADFPTLDQQEAMANAVAAQAPSLMLWYYLPWAMQSPAYMSVVTETIASLKH